MPVQMCERDGESGYKWGGSVTCYLPSEEGGEGMAKKKAILQGIAIEGEGIDLSYAEQIVGILHPETMDRDAITANVTELASIIDKPILRAGIFPYSNQRAGMPPLVITQEELDEIMEGSNRLQPIVKEAIQTGVYRGNEDLKLTKKIPGLLNLKHQQQFWDTIKDRVKDASMSFGKKLVDGPKGPEWWLTCTLDGLPSDIALTLQKDFPMVSAELLPLTDPDTGKHYAKIIRSIAFLDKLTDPAIPGQPYGTTVELMGSGCPVTVVTCNINKNKEKHIMEKNKEKEVDVAELQKAQATLTQQVAELQAALEAEKKAKEKEIEAEKAEKEAQAQRVIELQQKIDASETSTMLKEMQGKVRRYADKAYQLSPAFMEVITPYIQTRGVIELAEGEDRRERIMKDFEQIVELIGKQAVFVPISLQGATPHKRPDHSISPVDFDDEVHELMKTEGLSIGDAIEEVTARHQELKVKEAC